MQEEVFRAHCHWRFALTWLSGDVKMCVQPIVMTQLQAAHTEELFLESLKEFVTHAHRILNIVRKSRCRRIQTWPLHCFCVKHSLQVVSIVHVMGFLLRSGRERYATCKDAKKAPGSAACGAQRNVVWCVLRSFNSVRTAPMLTIHSGLFIRI